ncbi:MAG: hypothetical protein JF609_12020, partial [Verrucomicrobia bacterium]|nr:hypothetical protein [Verrucomicrobiota bacterium]
MTTCLVFNACHKSPPAAPPAPPAATNLTWLDWSLKTTVEAYRKNGATDTRWDGPAERALTEFARVRAQKTGDNEPVNQIISTNVAAAVAAGCTDPMVNYLFIKYSMSYTNSKEAFIAAFCKTANEMEKSSYPPIRKFYAGFRATQYYVWANNWPASWPEELSNIKRQTTDQLSAILADGTTPTPEIYDACHEFLESEKTSKDFFPQVWKCMEPLIFKYWPDDSSSWLLKGEANIHLAWQARGGGYANTVTDAGWKLF